ncbi:hypothetical protein BGY98DRAFT_1098118 [Russula aff. rugulosa BPL654]|nr:hypothetical protein BGY98DRAFT_1098118 [Russula aff. rugulosa BPL654]
MHLYRGYIVSWIFLILPIINLAVAAPVLVQEKLQACVDVVHIPEHAMTMLGKRQGELDEIFLDAEGHFAKPEYSANPEESSATRPSSSSQPLGLADWSTDVYQPLPSIPNEPPQVPSPFREPPSLADEWNEIWGDLIHGQFPSESEESSAARPSSSSQPSGPAGGSVDVEQPLPPIHEEQFPVSSQVHASPSLGPEWNKMWRDLIHSLSPSKPESSAARPLSISRPSGPAGVSMDVEKPLPSSSEGPSQVSNPSGAPLSADESHGLMKMWLDIIGHPKSHSFAKPLPSISEEVSSSDQPFFRETATIYSEEPSQVSSSGRASLSADDELTKMWLDITESAKPEESSAARTLLGLASGSSTESDHETLGVPPPPVSASPIVPPESSVLSTNPDSQWMGADFSSGKRKRP